MKNEERNHSHCVNIILANRTLSLPKLNEIIQCAIDYMDLVACSAQTYVSQRNIISNTKHFLFFTRVFEQLGSITGAKACQLEK